MGLVKRAMLPLGLVMAGAAATWQLQPEPPVLAQLKAGQEVIIQVAELPDGILAQIGEVREGQVFIEFNSPNPIVRPGMTVQVFVKLK